MNIAVCVKQIPDPATPYQLDPDDHFVVRPDDQVLDDTDRYGVELGLQLAEQLEGTVTLFSMGPAGSLQGIELRDRPAFSFQGHPEASPGPHDASYLFDCFAQMMTSGSSPTGQQMDEAQRRRNTVG